MMNPQVSYAKALDTLCTVAVSRGMAVPSADDPDALGTALELVAGERGSEAVSEIAKALLEHELQHLVWAPMDGAKFIHQALGYESPSRELLNEALVFLSLYFQELDELLLECRQALEGGLAVDTIVNLMLSGIESLDG